MQKEDYDEDIYKETKTKVIYKRLLASDSKLEENEHVFDEKPRRERFGYPEPKDSQMGRSSYPKREDSQMGLSSYPKREDSRRRSSERKDTRMSEDQDELNFRESATISLSGRNDRRTSQVGQKTLKEESNRLSTSEMQNAEIDPRQKEWVRVIRKTESKSSTKLPRRPDSDLKNLDKDTGDWAERTKKTAYYEGGSPSNIEGSQSKTGFYYPVDKWEVDYNNKNFIRSQCLKPQGLHRYVYGRPFDWDIDYNNRYYLISKVNVPKGQHRETYEITRKRVPNNDVLADATGWEFEYGPEFNQIEGDMPFYPRERIVGKGGYRFYGVRRNNSDCDRKIEERQEDIKNIFEEDYKYGHEFLQDDVPHIVEFKDMRIGRGGYRYIDVERNKCDINPKDVQGLDYKASRTKIHTNFEEEEKVQRKGKPFKQTIFKKTFKLIKPPSIEDFTHGTTLSFVPGASSKAFYEGKSTRPSRVDIKKHPSKRSKRDVLASEKKIVSNKKQISREHAIEFDQRRFKDEVPEKGADRPRHYSVDEFLRVQELRLQDKKRHTPDYYRGNDITESTQERHREVSENDAGLLRHHSVDELLRVEELVQQERKRHTPDYYRENGTTESNRETHGEKKRERHRFPPDVQTRIDEIRNITRDATSGSSTEDWKKHDHHPYDTGKSVTEGYEKYVNERGSEIWIKTEEMHSEFHHKKKK